MPTIVSLFADVLAKFNPHHDPDDGRFTSGPSGASGAAVADAPAGGASDNAAGMLYSRKAPVFSSEIQALTALDIPTRVKQFMEKSEAERDAIARPLASIKSRMQEILGDREWANTRKPYDEVRERVEAYVQDGTITPDAGHTITRQAAALIDHLQNAESPPLATRQLSRAFTDALITQEYESIGRALGDHGVRHLMQDADYAQEILLKIPGDQETPTNHALMLMAGAFHDVGYMTDAARNFLDADHPRHGVMHYEKNLRGTVTRALGSEAAGLLSEIIEKHAYGTVDWKKEPVRSAFSLADNMALFHQEKLPAMLRYVPANRRVLEALGAKTITADAAKAQMFENLSKTALHPRTKARIGEAIREVSPILPKFTLGMYGGTLQGFDWKNGGLQVSVARSPKKSFVTKYMDLGTRQFGKMLESFGIKEPLDQTLDKQTFGMRDGALTFHVSFTKRMAKSFLKWLDTLRYPQTP